MTVVCQISYRCLPVIICACCYTLIFTVCVFKLHMQALYEVAFASGKMIGSYMIYTVMPRKVVTPDVPLCQLSLQ